MNRSDCEHWILAITGLFGWGSASRVKTLWEGRPSRFYNWTFEDFSKLYFEIKEQQKIKTLLKFHLDDEYTKN